MAQFRPGRLNKWVTLSKAPDEPGDSDGFFEALSPAGVWAQIDPYQPWEADGVRMQSMTVIIRYHSQVTLDTRLLYGTRELFVKGVQNIDEANIWMRLYCEEVVK
jgi:head-tail adaptor